MVVWTYLKGTPQKSKDRKSACMNIDSAHMHSLGSCNIVSAYIEQFKKFTYLFAYVCVTNVCTHLGYMVDHTW